MSSLIEVVGVVGSVVMMLVLATPYIVSLSLVCWDILKCSKE